VQRKGIEMLPRFALLCVGAAAMFAGTAAAETPVDHYSPETAPPIDNRTQTESLPFLNDAANRMTVAVTVGGAGPYQFMVDTGSERTTISRRLARQLQLKPGSGVRLHSIVGVGPAQTAIIPELRFSQKAIGSIEAPLLDAINMGADGMLGVDSLKSQRILFDFKANTMSVTHASERVESLGDGTIVVRARARRGRLVVANATADKETLTVVLDTGSQVTIGNMALRKALLGREMLGTAKEVTLQSVTGATMIGSYMMLKELTIGGIGLKDLAVAFVDAHTFKQLGLEKKPALLLGMNAMRAFDRVSIDFANKRLRVILPKESRADGIQLAAK
jgi:hypothetical protein